MFEQLHVNTCISELICSTYFGTYSAPDVLQVNLHLIISSASLEGDLCMIKLQAQAMAKPTTLYINIEEAEISLELL